MLFFGTSDWLPINRFVPTLLFSPHGLGLLVTGTAVGALFAAATFSISAISVPMLLDRKVDAMTAILASIRAIAENPAAMALWAGLIATLIVAGIASLFIGLAITFPLIGHATWHAYKALAGNDES